MRVLRVQCSFLLSAERGTNMNNFFERLSEVNSAIYSVVWGPYALVLLVGTGILMTLLTKFFQITHIGHWFKQTIGSVFKKSVSGHTEKSDKSISQFQSMCTALAATVGVGNIAGVASAIATGGAGAVFWMWIAAFFGMMTGFSENVLGIFYRRKNAQGEWSGGAMYYLKDGLGSKKGFKWVGKVLAALFAIFTVLAAFGIGNMGQVNKIVANIQAAFKIKSLSSVVLYTDGESSVTLYSALIGAVVLILAGLIILGGVKRIGAVAEKVVPFMVVLYVIGSLIVIGVNYDMIGTAFYNIFKTAFSPVAAAGGTFGYLVSVVITQGFKRGVFSNEAGLGSSVMVHCSGKVKEPVHQGMWSIFEIFVDTIVVCTMTALVILTSGVFDFTTGAVKEGAGSEATLVANAFDTVFTFGTVNVGSKFIAVAIFLFAFTTILGWSHYGAKAFEYLFGTKATVVYKVIFVLMIMSGALLTSSLAWDISDTFNGLMMIPNLIGVIALSGLVVKITKNYIDRKFKGKKIKPLLSAIPAIQAEMEQTED